MINDSINRFLGVLCYPFSSMEMFREDLIQKYIESINENKAEVKIDSKKIKEQLKKALIKYVRKNYNIYSYDEIYLYLEKCYFYEILERRDCKNAIDLYCYIMECMATSLISHRDGKIVFKYWKNEKDEEMFGGFAAHNKVALFHNINCHIPMDVIAIVYMLKNSRGKDDISCLNYFYGNIDVSDQQLERILEKGVAENHLHKGVSRSFSSSWDSLMEPITAKNRDSFYGFEFGDTEEEDGWILFCVLACNIIRAYLMLEFIGRNPFENCFKVNSNITDNDEKEIHKLLEYFREGNVLERFYMQQFGEKDEKEIIAYYLDLWEKLAYFLPKNILKENFCKKVFGESMNLHTFDENVFLYRALQVLLNKEADFNIRQCIMQYLRIRNYLFRVSVQQKTIKGLDYFQQEHYRISSHLGHMNVTDFWKNAIREQLQNQNIHKIEFRTSFSDKSSELKKDVINFLKAYEDVLLEDYYQVDGKEGHLKCKIPQVGLVMHFLKRLDETIPEKCFENGRIDCTYFHFGRLQRYYQAQIDNFVKLRSECSELSKYLVGIDAASLENATPLWVFAPIYERARDGCIDRIGRRQKEDAYIQSLGFTFHAGEDFRHILSGLRRIDEAVEYLKFHAGDRIGHGIVLGVSAKEWKEKNPVIIIPQIEALENYLWAYDMLSKNYSNFHATILSYMEKKIFELAKHIYGTIDGLSVESLVQGYQRMFDVTGNESIFFEEHVNSSVNEGKNKVQLLRREFCDKICAKEEIKWNVDLLVAARHCKNFIRKMEFFIHYEITDQDMVIIEELQKILLKKLGKKGIVIEVNPSSNTAIADLDTFAQNQFYKVNDAYDTENLIVCINSDDPAVFNTNVSNELAYIYYGMMEHNVSRETALHWIDRIRENGINSSFIHRQESDEMILKNLQQLICMYK